MNDLKHLSRWPVIMLLTVSLVALAPAIQAQEDPVTVSVAVSGSPVPGGSVRATATVEIMDGSTVQSYAWTQTGGVPARRIRQANQRTARIDLGFRRPYKARLLQVLDEPPIGPEQLPPNVPVPPEDFPAGLHNRFYIPGLNPFTLEEAGLVTLEVAVTTTSGTYHGEAEIHTELPWKRTSGIRSVAIGIPVVLYGKEQASYNWSLTAPAGSAATLVDAGTRSPEFTPDIPGVYEVRVRDLAAGSPVSLTIYAGTWRGVIVGQDADGRPVPEGLCTACHSGGPARAPDKFTPWAQTGHAEIFTQILNTSGTRSVSCFNCHSLGYDPDVDNGGMDEAPDYPDFLGSGLIGNPSPNNWTTVLEDFPATAQLANVQCESCHGPASSEPRQDTLAHGWRTDVVGEPRVSLSADVCAYCHGEPLRHGRYEQWQLSKHADYDLAIDRSQSGHCSRCHTANGFLTWLPILLGEVPGDPLANIEVTWTEDEAHPQTCPTCHDPHNTGTTSGSDPNARVRISGDTPMLIAGFRVVGAGKAAICMTCHNSRRGLFNDDTFAELVASGDISEAPHGSVQTDMLMGENAFGVNVGVRGPHSLIVDPCVTCHMEKTPPPAALSYNQSGTNHTFFASPDICQECHEEIISAEVLQGIVETLIEDVRVLVVEAVEDLLAEQIAAGNTIRLGGVTITNAASIAEIGLDESRGRQALTVTLTNGTIVGPVAVNAVMVVRPTPLPAVELYAVADEGLIKAIWNWSLIHADGSRGAHNPRYALSVLDAARDEVAPGRPGPRSRDLLASLIEQVGGVK